MWYMCSDTFEGRLAYLVTIIIQNTQNNFVTRHTHSVNASCSYEVHEDIICIHTNGSLDVALL